MKEKKSNNNQQLTSLSAGDGSAAYPTCDEIFGKNAFEMVEDYLESGYYDEAIFELEAMRDIIKNDFPERDESKHH